ncbi:MAG: hypothetical protein IJB09_03040 [Oscillospiraceae bacterium]|nr:hypothetical protein [Oscillospiraceae bacterium]
MKKIISIVLALIFAFCACGSTVLTPEEREAIFYEVAKEKGMLDNENPSPYELSKSAYENINVAYKIIRQIGDDMYEVWKACIGEHDKVLSYGSDYLATKVSLSEEEIRIGLAMLRYGDALNNMNQVQRQRHIDDADVWIFYFDNYENNMVAACVCSIVNAYFHNGKFEEAETALDTAKENLKILSADYSDYEHYLNLKGFFTTTRAYLDYCQNLEGPVKQLIDYKEQAKEYIGKLDYYFED